MSHSPSRRRRSCVRRTAQPGRSTPRDDAGMTDFAAARRAARAGDFTPLTARIPYSNFLGVVVQMNDDTPLFRLPFRKQLIGNKVIQALHGGVVAGFMENAAMLHMLLVLDEAR